MAEGRIPESLTPFICKMQGNRPKADIQGADKAWSKKRENDKKGFGRLCIKQKRDFRKVR